MDLIDGAWTGRRCFVVGGGASLRGFDWGKLDGELVLAVNRAWEVVSGLVVSMDPGFWQLHGPAIAATQRQALHVRVGDEKLPPHGPTDVVRCCADSGRANPHLEPVWGTSLETGVGCGGNSGFAAVNVADCFGASPIYLLGFDMRGDGAGGQAWWHDGYPWRQSERVYDRHRAAFGLVAGEVHGQVVNLIGCEPSALECFPLAPIESVLGD